MDKIGCTGLREKVDIIDALRPQSLIRRNLQFYAVQCATCATTGNCRAIALVLCVVQLTKRQIFGVMRRFMKKFESELLFPVRISFEIGRRTGNGIF